MGLVATAVRGVIPEDMPLLVRLSATDWAEDGPSWDLEQTITLVAELKEAGVDLIDVTSGGLIAAEIPVGPDYLVRFAEEIRARTGVPTAAVGLITAPEQAEVILAEDRADAVMIGRELGVRREDIPYPDTYWRGAWRDPR